MSKICKLCGAPNENILMKYCKACYYEVVRTGTGTSISRMSDKAKNRIRTNGSEVDLFKKVWSERPHQCEECGKVLNFARPHNFDHIKPKGMNPEERYNPANIRILCFAHHFEKQF